MLESNEQVKYNEQVNLDELENSYKPQIIYKSIISTDLQQDILSYYNSVEINTISDKSSIFFPIRKSIKEIPLDLAEQLVKECIVTMSQYYTYFKPNIEYIRIYHSNYGIVKPHKDVPIHPNYTHTCLIYLTDDYDGGILSIKLPRSDEHIKTFGSFDKKHLTITMEPRKSYGVIFPKDTIHYNNELLCGDKIILLIDCEIIY
jgi:hypothetical protein